MKTTLSEFARISLRDLTSTDRLDRQGDEHFERLERAILGTHRSAVIALDLRELDYIGYSYTKRVLREVLMQRNEGKYDDRRFFIVADQGDEFLEGLEAALLDKKLFMMVTGDIEDLKEARLIGAVPDYLEETFKILLRVAPIPTGSLAKLLDQSPQNTKNRLDRLFEMGLLRREKEVSPTGGLEWVNWVL